MNRRVVRRRSTHGLMLFAAPFVGASALFASGPLTGPITKCPTSTCDHWRIRCNSSLWCCTSGGITQCCCQPQSPPGGCEGVDPNDPGG